MDKKATIAWQTTPTVAGLGQNGRGITVGEKPTLAVLPLAKKNHFKGEIRRLIEHYRTVFGEDPGLRLMITEDVLFDEGEIVSTARQMEQDGADLIVLVVGTWLFSSIVASTVVDLNTPVVLYGLSDQIANGNLGASLQIRYVLQEMGRKPSYLCGPIADEKNLDTIRRYVKAAWVKRYLRNRNLATIGGKCMMMYQTQVNEFDWKRVFGVDFPQYDTAQVLYEMENVDEAWLNIIGYQSCHFYDEEALAWHVSGPPATDWKEDPPRPFINLEPSYENILDMRNDTGRRFDARDVRRAMYWSLLVSPTAGVSYGGHGVWGWDDGGGPPVAHPTTGTPLPWREALLMPAAEQITHLANLFGSIEWWRLRPAPELVAVQPGHTAPRRFVAASRSDAGDLALVYVPGDRRVELYLGSLNPGLSASWFDPRGGEFTPATPMDLQERSCFNTPTPSDWVLLLK